MSYIYALSVLYINMYICGDTYTGNESGDFAIKIYCTLLSNSPSANNVRILSPAFT